MTEEEWQHIERLSELAELPMSEVVRASLHRVRIVNRADHKRRTILLNRVNANLNMIAKWVNTHLDLADRVEVLSHLISIEKKIEELDE